MVKGRTCGGVEVVVGGGGVLTLPFPLRESGARKDGFSCISLAHCEQSVKTVPVGLCLLSAFNAWRLESFPVLCFARSLTQK